MVALRRGFAGMARQRPPSVMLDRVPTVDLAPLPSIRSNGGTADHPHLEVSVRQALQSLELLDAFGVSALASKYVDLGRRFATRFVRRTEPSCQLRQRHRFNHRAKRAWMLRTG